MQNYWIKSAVITSVAFFAAVPYSMALDMPEKGLKKSTVETTFGAPLSKTPAVGEPPISHWQYQDYTVYFESEYVIHSVATQKESDAVSEAR